MKTILVKTLLIPVIGYPKIPICMASTKEEKKETSLDKALRFFHCNEQGQLNTRELAHLNYY